MRPLVGLLVGLLVVSLVIGPGWTPNARAFPRKSGITKTEKRPPALKTKTEAHSTQPVKPGGKAQNLRVLPPWTMRLCTEGLFAAYDFDGAKELKKIDTRCWYWQTIASLSEAQAKDFGITMENLKTLVKTYKEERQIDRDRIQVLLKQVNTEIAEKNKYKYRPDYRWLWISIGAAVALAGMAFGTGVWIAKD